MNFKNTLIFTVTLLLTVLIVSCRSHRHKKESVSDIKTVEIKFDNKTEKKLVEEAISWIGTPYGYGESEKGVATDCSGMVLVIYRDVAGIDIPRNSAKQAEFCEKISQKKIKPGDLVFFATGKDQKQISHVGIMIDENRFVHSSASKGVIMSEMTTPYYSRTFIMYGRVPGHQ